MTIIWLSKFNYKDFQIQLFCWDWNIKFKNKYKNKYKRDKNKRDKCKKNKYKKDKSIIKKFKINDLK